MKSRPQIGIFYRRPRDFYLFRALYHALGGTAEFIAAPPFEQALFLHNWGEAALEAFEGAVRFISQQGVSWRRAPVLEPRNNDRDDIKNFFAPYELLLDTRNSVYFILPENAAKTKVLYLYDDFITGCWPPIGFSHIDAVFTTGDNSKDALAPFVSVEVVGNLYVEGVADAPPPAFLRLDARKKTILYLPHEASFLSPEEFSGAINELSIEYNVVVQLTHETAAAGKNIHLFSLNKRVAIVDESYDVRTLKNRVDLAVSDDILTVFEWRAMGKPAILLDLWTRDILRSRGSEPTNGYDVNGWDLLRLSRNPEGLKDSALSMLRGDAAPEHPAEKAMRSGFFADIPSPSRNAALSLGEILNKKPRPNPAAAFMLRPADVTAKNYLMYHFLRPLFNSVNEIFREQSLMRKCRKIIQMFF